jgi:uncharacterized protein (DUF3820 family)
MTSHDLMPFGKFKDLELGEVPGDYVDWLMQQDWFTDPNGRWADIFAYFSAESDEAIATDGELARDKMESDLLNEMPKEFLVWWTRQYGIRFKQTHADMFIPYLRVAREAWLAATGKDGAK